MNVALFDLIYNVSSVGWFVLLASFLSAFLSGVIFWQDTIKRSNKFFLFFGIVVGVWGVAYAFFDCALGTQYMRTATVVLYSVATIVPISMFLYMHTFSTKIKISLWKFVMMGTLYLFIVIVLTSSDFIVGYKEVSNGGAGEIIFGRWYLLYVICMIGFVIAGFINLIDKYHASAGIFRATIRNLITVFLIACFVAIFVTLIFPFLGGGYSLFWLGHLSAVSLILVTAYILSRYNFWNLRVITVEFFIFVIIIVLIVELFFANSIIDLFIKSGITILVIFSSSFLAGSVSREIEYKDKIDHLLRELDITNKRLKILDKNKSEFLSMASHHLRDPLTAMKGYASMLSEGSFGNLPDEVKEAINRIFESSKRLITMIADFLDISRIESGEMKYNFVDVDMKKLVFELKDEMALSADNAHIGLAVTVDEDVFKNNSFITVGDAGKLRQVVSNLLDNSIKYTPHGEVSASLSKSSDGKKILFNVSDTGIGMSNETLEKIFKKFSRAEGVNKVYTEGTGLGLYVAKEIVKKHEGRIWAESKGEGLGSSFFVELEAKL